MQLEFNAKKRDGQGTGASRRLRRTGRVPGILYGGTSAPQQIDIDHNELFQLLRKEAFYSSVLNVNLEGAKYTLATNAKGAELGIKDFAAVGLISQTNYLVAARPGIGVDKLW